MSCKDCIHCKACMHTRTATLDPYQSRPSNKDTGECSDWLTTDIQEVKHAKWIPSKKQYGMVICSNCHRDFCCEWIHYKYCYECGAKMDLEDNE